MAESRFNFLKNDFSELYEKCTQAEQAVEYDVAMLRIRQALEYMIHDLGAQNKDLFQGINELESRNILDWKVSQRFHAIRRLANQAVHANIKTTKEDIQKCLNDLLFLTLWYGLKKGKSYTLEQFSPSDIASVRNYLVNTGKLPSKTILSTSNENTSVDPLSLVSSFQVPDEEVRKQNILERDVFETEEEYEQRIADMDPIHIGYGILDTRRKDGYTDINFLIHHIDHNSDVKFSPINAFYVQGIMGNQVIDGELVAKLKACGDKVCCDYNKVSLRINNNLIAVHPIYWEKFFYENSEECNKRISKMPLIPVGVGMPLRSQYDLKTLTLPFFITPFQYVENIFNHILPKKILKINCTRDLAKKICNSPENCILFCKLQGVKTIKKYVLWQKDAGVVSEADLQEDLNQCPKKVIRKNKQIQVKRNTSEECQKKDKSIESLDNVNEDNIFPQNNLGDCYYYGRGVEQNYHKAVQYYQKDAEKGDASAQNNLGNCYYYGKGVEQNYQKAVQWYQKAAEQGNVRAQCNLGGCYDAGRGIIRDIDKKVQWYQKAANQGDAEGQYLLGLHYFFANAEDEEHRCINKQKATEWFQKAACQGNVEAQYRIGDIYDIGTSGIPRNKKKALEWYLKAAKQNHREAEYRLGGLFLLGEDGIQPDAQKAIKWFQKASAQGDGYASLQIGKMYYNGDIGTEKDYQKAEEWFQKAIKQNPELEKDVKKVKGKSSCFITTAVCNSLNKSDDCYELTRFRRFRDHWLALQEDGPSLIEEYYTVAPKIVKKINEKANRADIYRQIWRDYLKPCLTLIEERNYTACKDLYVDMVKNLQKKYL